MRCGAWRAFHTSGSSGSLTGAAAGLVAHGAAAPLGGNERVGVFATRSPFRPNGLGLSAVELERVALDEPEGPVLYVRGADMVSGTPIVDIKPYLAYADSYPDAAGGFTGGDAGAVLTVDFPPELLAQFDSGQRHGLLSALARRPAAPVSGRP